MSTFVLCDDSEKQPEHHVAPRQASRLLLRVVTHSYHTSLGPTHYICTTKTFPFHNYPLLQENTKTGCLSSCRNLPWFSLLIVFISSLYKSLYFFSAIDYFLINFSRLEPSDAISLVYVYCFSYQFCHCLCYSTNQGEEA